MLRLDQIDLEAVVQGRANDRAETHRFLDVATGAVRPGWSPGADPQPGRWEIIHPTGMGGHKVYRDRLRDVLLFGSHARGHPLPRTSQGGGAAGLMTDPSVARLTRPCHESAVAEWLER